MRWETANISVAFAVFSLYNFIIQNTRSFLWHILTHFYYFVKKGIAGMEESEITARREIVLRAVNECTDLDMLDLVYKLLASNDI